MDLDHRRGSLREGRFRRHGSCAWSTGGESDEFINELVTQDTNGQPALVLAALMKGHHFAAEQAEQSHKSSGL